MYFLSKQFRRGIDCIFYIFIFSRILLQYNKYDIEPSIKPSLVEVRATSRGIMLYYRIENVPFQSADSGRNHRRGLLLVPAVYNIYIIYTINNVLYHKNIIRSPIRATSRILIRAKRTDPAERSAHVRRCVIRHGRNL